MQAVAAPMPRLEPVMRSTAVRLPSGRGLAADPLAQRPHVEGLDQRGEGHGKVDVAAGEMERQTKFGADPDEQRNASATSWWWDAARWTTGPEATYVRAERAKFVAAITMMPMSSDMPMRGDDEIDQSRSMTIN